MVLPAFFPFASYFLYAYVALPLSLTGLRILYGKRYELCPLLRCIRPLVKCVKEPACLDWLNDVQQCSSSSSEAMEISAKTFAHVQHPEDPAFCRYQSFDRLETSTALEFLECIGNSGCLEPSPYTDVCWYDVPIEKIMPLHSIEDILAGTWSKLYTTGWDVWPCQWTEFWPPHTTAEAKSPDPWMHSWPGADNVWRMDLYWKNSPTGNVTFHMSNEMYPEKTWVHPPPNSSFEEPYVPVAPNATLRTRAVMWGTEAHENWYLLDYNEDLQTILVYYCAHTEAVNRFDSIAMVLQKHVDGLAPPQLTLDQAKILERKTKQILGETHGKIQRIPGCA